MMKRRGFLSTSGTLAASAAVTAATAFLGFPAARARTSDSTENTPRPESTQNPVEVFGQLPNPAAIRKVFAAGPPAAVLIAALAPDMLMGWPQNLSSSAARLLSPQMASLPFLGRLSGRGSTMPLEKLLALKPDLIVDAGTIDDSYRSMAQRVHQQTGIPYVLIGGRLPESIGQLQTMGRLLNRVSRANDLCAYAAQTLKLAASFSHESAGHSTAATPTRPSIYLARSADGLETGLQGSITTELIDLIGARNAAASAGRGSLARCSMEQLYAWNPTYLLTQDQGFAQSLRDAAATPLWQQLEAVRAGRILLAPSAPFGWVDGPPGINRFIGIRWLLARLRGSATSPEAQARMQQQARDFYQLFYGTPASEPVPTGA